MGPRLKLPPIAPCAGPKDVRKFLTSRRREVMPSPPLKRKAAAKIVDGVVVFKHACAPACKGLSRSGSTDRVPLTRGISGQGLSLQTSIPFNPTERATRQAFTTRQISRSLACLGTLLYLEAHVRPQRWGRPRGHWC
jgi:hypothetical protein